MTGKTFELDQPKPDGDWIGWKAWMELSGSHHRASAVAQFAIAAQRAREQSGQFDVVLKREPENPADRNAIVCLGRVDGETWPLGYVPRAEARELGKLSRDMPLTARVIRVRFFGDSVFVTVQLLIPSKKWRTSRNW